MASNPRIKHSLAYWATRIVLYGWIIGIMPLALMVSILVDLSPRADWILTRIVWTTTLLRRLARIAGGLEQDQFSPTRSR